MTQLQRVYRKAMSQDRVEKMRRPSMSLQQTLFNRWQAGQRQAGKFVPADLTPR
jgi:hypothetical protein